MLKEPKYRGSTTAPMGPPSRKIAKMKPGTIGATSNKSGNFVAAGKEMNTQEGAEDNRVVGPFKHTG